MITIGVDFAKHSSQYHVLNDQGKKMQSVKIANNPSLFRSYIEHLPGPKQLTMEACRNWGLYYDQVHDLVDDFHLGPLCQHGMRHLAMVN